MNFNDFLQTYGYADVEDLIFWLKDMKKSDEEISSIIADYSEKYEQECRLIGCEAEYL